MSNGPTEAIILAGGKAERLGAAAGGKPKPLVAVAGRPLMSYQIASLAKAGVERVLVSCGAGLADLFVSELDGLPVEIVPVEEPEPLGRGGGLRRAAEARSTDGDVYALNGDELLPIDFAALAARHREANVLATIVVAQPRSPFGVVELTPGDLVCGFDEGARVPWWVSCGVYVLSEQALHRLPERGDHESTTFPDLASERALAAFRHDGVWLTVNTPKDLKRAEEYLVANPDWAAEGASLLSSIGPPPGRA
jgi:NDP-sugar pyrophosphorylase family protein